MTDKELLELAAKAAGIEYGWQYIYDDYEGSTSEKWDWNPLTDDGDALRLAVKLNITVLGAIARTDCSECTEFNLWKTDPDAATRQAIVRAAAEIGKGITQELSGQELLEDNYYKHKVKICNNSVEF